MGSNLNTTTAHDREQHLKTLRHFRFGQRLWAFIAYQKTASQYFLIERQRLWHLAWVGRTHFVFLGRSFFLFTWSFFNAAHQHHSVGGIIFCFTAGSLFRLCKVHVAVGAVTNVHFQPADFCHYLDDFCFFVISFCIASTGIAWRESEALSGYTFTQA